MEDKLVICTFSIQDLLSFIQSSLNHLFTQVPFEYPVYIIVRGQESKHNKCFYPQDTYWLPESQTPKI